MELRGLIIIAIIIALYWALKLLFRDIKESFTKPPNTYFLIFSIILVLSVNYGIIFFGSKVPGSLFERRKYETILYVHLYPNEQKVKSYKVPAKISRIRREGCYPGVDDVECDYWSEYRIYYARMPNGGTIDFSDWLLYKPLELGRVVWI